MFDVAVSVDATNDADDLLVATEDDDDTDDDNDAVAAETLVDDIDVAITADADVAPGNVAGIDVFTVETIEFCSVEFSVFILNVLLLLLLRCCCCWLLLLVRLVLSLLLCVVVWMDIDVGLVTGVVVGVFVVVIAVGIVEIFGGAVVVVCDLFVADVIADVAVAAVGGDGVVAAVHPLGVVDISDDGGGCGAARSSCKLALVLNAAPVNSEKKRESNPTSVQ